MRIFRTLLIAAVNAIKEFLAFATDNGASQVGDTIKLNDGMATSNYDWSAYPSDTTVIGNYTATGTVEKIKEVNGETVYVTNEPEQDNKDVSIKAGEVYYAYTNENDNTDSVYTTDNPISKGEFTLQNLTNSGCTINNNLAYGSANNHITINNIPNLNTLNTWSFHTKFTDNGGGGGTYGQCILGTASGYSIRLGTKSGHNLFCCLSGDGSSWDIAGDNTSLNKTLTQGNTYYLEFGYDGTKFYCKCEETPITSEIQPIWTLTSPTKLHTGGGLWLLNYNYSPGSEYFTGPIDLSETYFILDGDIVNFGFFTNTSILYENTGTNEFVPTALDPQPSFTIQNIGLINASVVGTLTNNNGVYSGFSDDNYISCPDYINATETLNSFEIVTAINMSEASTSNLGIIDTTGSSGKTGIRLTTSPSNTIQFRVSVNGETTYPIDITGTTSLGTNTWKYIKVTYSSSIGYEVFISDDGETWHSEGTSNNTTRPFISATRNTLTIGDNAATGFFLTGSINMKNTSVTIDGQKTNFYNTSSDIIIGNTLYERNINKDEVKDISGLTVNIETVDNTTINSITINNNQNTPYFAYSSTSNTYYAKDNELTTSSKLYNENFEELQITPSSIITPSLINAETAGTGTLSEYNGSYSGFSTTAYLKSTVIFDTSNYSSWELKTKIVTPSSFRDSRIFSNAIADYITPVVGLSNQGKFSLFLSSNGTQWNLVSGTQSSNALQTNKTYYIKFIYDGSKYQILASLNNENSYVEYLSVNESTKQYSSSNSYLSFGRTGWTANEYFNGIIDMKATSFTADGVVTNFYNDDNIVIINNENCTRNISADLYKTEASSATIETSANVTTANNGITDADGSRHSFNITVPSTKVAYIESAGISYQASDMPIDVYNGRGVGIAIKDSANSQTSYYINSWVVNKNYDLHYQQITFTTNVENPTIIFKINNNVIESPYYGYYGDNYTYTISKKGYEDYNGSGKISYSSKNGNIINIEANLTPSSNSIDVTGWTYSIDNGVVTLLDGPVDASGELTFPNIEEE